MPEVVEANPWQAGAFEQRVEVLAGQVARVHGPADGRGKHEARGVIEAVTGAGKTRVALAAAEEQLRRGGRVVVVVPTKELLNQWRKEIEKLLKGELGMKFSVGLFGGGRDDRFQRPDVLIATAQSGCQNHLLLYGVERPGWG